MSKRYDESYISKLLTEESNRIFEEERGVNKLKQLYAELQSSAKNSQKSDMVDLIDDEEKSFDFPIDELVARRITGELRDEFKDLIENEKPIWEYAPDKVVSLFKTLKIDVEEAVQRIKEQFIFPTDLGSVMARSDNASTKQFSSANTQFALKIQEDRRDKFIKAFRENFK